MNPPQPKLRLRIAVRGAVQGVGFRPFIYRLARELELTGSVSNSPQGVGIEAEGPRDRLEAFVSRIRSERPPRSFIAGMESAWLEPVGHESFEIVASESAGPKTALVLPDIATCDECRAEIFDPSNRRFFYPFTNCTNCGPRFSIIHALPYDRPNTSMRGFPMCPECRAEYDDPANRRFHAQPNACAKCGPHLELWDAAGNRVLGAAGDTAESVRDILGRATEALKAGRIVALKGLGGFHLLVNARDEEAVERLRRLKHREEKPFALMFPSMEAIRAECHVSSAEERLLVSPESPIVLLRARPEEKLAGGIAPRNPWRGVMLPYTPLHYLLLSVCGFPLVATSGNLADEPICTDEQEAVARLGGIADMFVVHNRPIERHVDDSIVRIVAGREMLMRRARGYAPAPVVSGLLPSSLEPVLATGAHLKNTVAITNGDHVFLSQHIGDLETEAAFGAFKRASVDLQRLYELHPRTIVADAHPDYVSARYAREQAELTGAKLRIVQHHEAHVWACMAENDVQPPALGVAWDGTGYGTDGTIWGGEFFLATESGCRRIAHLRQFRLPGGDQAVKEPRRSALGILFEIFGADLSKAGQNPAVASLPQTELRVIEKMLSQGFNSPVTSSAGRLFDAVASLSGLRHFVRHEGQAAMELEFAAEEARTDERYPAPLSERLGMSVLDWEPMIREILKDVRQGLEPARIAARFQNTMVEWIVAVANLAGQERVVLSGGCFQNVFLAEQASKRLSDAGFHPFLHQRVPPNDGGIALGQAVGTAILNHGNKEPLGEKR